MAAEGGGSYDGRLIADDASLHIIPTHPDGTGGFLPVGRACLFLCLFTLLAGIATAGLTFQVFLDAANPGGTISKRGMFKEVITLWGLDMILGPLLLFLPIWSLRWVMITPSASTCGMPNNSIEKRSTCIVLMLNWCFRQLCHPSAVLPGGPDRVGCARGRLAIRSQNTSSLRRRFSVADSRGPWQVSNRVPAAQQAPVGQAAPGDQEA